MSRPRIRRLVERAAHRGLRAVAADRPTIVDPEPLTPPPPTAADFARKLVPGLLAKEHATVTLRLFDRLDKDDVAEVESRLLQTPDLQEHFASAPTPELHKALVLAYGLWLGVAAVSEKTGLNSDQPPEDVHTMARGPLAAAGGLYEADLVIDALVSVGLEPDTINAALDFGCSSGRVVRVLAAAYPDVQWHGCDPNGPAIAWAAANLGGIEFFASADRPPLPLAESSLDLAYAISIWSHFEPKLGLLWFDEMARVIRPGGHLVWTTHGFLSVELYAKLELRTPAQSQEIAEDLYRQGWWYAPEFGEAGDWGVINPDWGTAFLSPEWVLAQLCPSWRVLEFAPGRNQSNQDVYVLQRV